MLVYLPRTFVFEGFEWAVPFDYSRTARPTGPMLPDTLAGPEGGVGAVITADLVAIDPVVPELGHDDLIAVPRDCYAGTYRPMSARSGKGQFAVPFVDQTDERALASGDNDPRRLLPTFGARPASRIAAYKFLPFWGGIRSPGAISDSP